MQFDSIIYMQRLIILHRSGLHACIYIGRFLSAWGVHGGVCQSMTDMHANVHVCLYIFTQQNMENRFEFVCLYLVCCESTESSLIVHEFLPSCSLSKYVKVCSLHARIIL